jgi:aspartate/methionine/tyrosine aminotransferase
MTETLTDLEVAGLGSDFNLADGHAYQELGQEFADIIEDLSAIWQASETVPVPEAEHTFREAFAALAGSSGMAQLPFFKICATASNSIDVIGTILAARKLKTALVEPVFDNLSLLLRRRGVVLEAIGERVADEDEMTGELEQSSSCSGGALVIVQPGNPTGRNLTARALRRLAEYCAARQKVLVMDNSFRFYNREPYDDYAILVDSGVSFLAVEDTGKVLPTHDLKASLLFCSHDLEHVTRTVYNETYLCSSRFVLMLLARLLYRAADLGLAHSIWPTVDERRLLLRTSIVGTGIEVDRRALQSQISVEWLYCHATGLTDLELTALLAESGVLVLPGRLFFWHSGDDIERHYNIRIALMKPARKFGLSSTWCGSREAG